MNSDFDVVFRRSALIYPFFPLSCALRNVVLFDVLLKQMLRSYKWTRFG